MRKILYLLGQLSDTDVEWVIANGHKERLGKGTVLIHEGQPVEALYILLTGSLEVSAAGLQAKTPIRLVSGDVVGEVSFVDTRPPMANVTAASDSVVLAIPRARLLDKLESDPPFAARFYRSLAVFLSHRLRNTVQNLGYGKEQPLKEDQEYADELGDEVLDSLHMAGTRFDRVLQRLITAAG